MEIHIVSCCFKDSLNVTAADGKQSIEVEVVTSTSNNRFSTCSSNIFHDQAKVQDEYQKACIKFSEMNLQHRPGIPGFYTSPACQILSKSGSMHSTRKSTYRTLATLNFQQFIRKTCDLGFRSEKASLV